MGMIIPPYLTEVFSEKFINVCKLLRYYGHAIVKSTRTLIIFLYGAGFGCCAVNEVRDHTFNPGGNIK